MLALLNEVGHTYLMSTRHEKANDLERTGKMIRKSYRVIVGLNLGTEHAKVLATKTFDDAHGDALKWAMWNFDTRPEPRIQVNISEEQTNQQKEW